MTRRVRLLVLAAGLGVISIMVVQTGPRRLLDLTTRIGWNVLTMAALYAAHVVLRAVSLWAVIRKRQVPLVDVLRVRLSAEAVEVLTYTGPFLAEPAKGWLLTRRGLSPTEAFAAVAIEYLLYTTASAALALVAFALLATSGTLPSSVQRTAAVVATLMGLFLIAVAGAAVTGVGLIAPILRRSGNVLGRSRMTQAADAFEPVEHLLIEFLHTRPVQLAIVLASEVVGHALLVAEIWVVLHALDASSAALTPLVIEGAAKIIGVVFFFIPGQVGASEGVYAALARAVGLPASIGLTLALLRRLRSVAVGALGLVTLSLDDRRDAA